MVNRHVRNVRKLCLKKCGFEYFMGESVPLLRGPEAPLLPFDGVVISREGPTRTTHYKSGAGFVFDTKRQKRERESQALQVVVFLSPSTPTCSFCNQGCKISGMPKRTCRERLTPPSLFQLNSSVARCERKREVFFHPPSQSRRRRRFGLCSTVQASSPSSLPWKLECEKAEEEEH